MSRYREMANMVYQISNHKDVEQLAILVEFLGEQLNNSFDFNSFVAEVDFDKLGDFRTLLENLSDVHSFIQCKELRSLEIVIELCFVLTRVKELYREYEPYVETFYIHKDVVTGFLSRDRKKIRTLTNNTIKFSEVKSND